MLLQRFLWENVRSTTRKVKPFPADVMANLSVMETAHARLKRPVTLGRTISMDTTSDEVSQSAASLHDAAPYLN